MRLSGRSKGIDIVVWRGVIVAYELIRELIGSGETIRQATQEELKRYWDRD